MKALLASMCIFVIVVILFFGGCTIAFSGSMGGGGLGFLPLILIATLALNGMILYGLFGAAKPFKPAFYILGGIDFLIAIGTLFSMSSILGGSFNDTTSLSFFAVFLAIVALKGALTIYFARKS